LVLFFVSSFLQITDFTGITQSRHAFTAEVLDQNGVAMAEVAL